VLPEAGVLKKLSLAELAKLSRPRYKWLRFGLASAGYRGLRGHDRPVYTTQQANSQLIPQSSMKFLGLARLAYLSGVSWLYFPTKTSASVIWSCYCWLPKIRHMYYTKMRWLNGTAYKPYTLFVNSRHQVRKLPVAEFIDPDWGDKVNSARLHGAAASTTTQCRSWLYPPITDLWIRLQKL
jgi:hypothetical protein